MPSVKTTGHTDNSTGGSPGGPPLYGTVWYHPRSPGGGDPSHRPGYYHTLLCSQRGILRINLVDCLTHEATSGVGTVLEVLPLAVQVHIYSGLARSGGSGTVGV